MASEMSSHPQVGGAVKTCSWVDSGSQHIHTKVSGQGAHAGSSQESSRACKQLRWPPLDTVEPILLTCLCSLSLSSPKSWSGDSAQNLVLHRGKPELASGVSCDIAAI